MSFVLRIGLIVVSLLHLSADLLRACKVRRNRVSCKFGVLAVHLHLAHSWFQFECPSFTNGYQAQRAYAAISGRKIRALLP